MFDIDGLRLIADFPDPLLVVERKGQRVLNASIAAAAMFGCTQEELRQLTLPELLGGVALDALEPGRSAITSGRYMPRTGEPGETQVYAAATLHDLLLIVLRAGRDPVVVAHELHETNRFLEAVVENIPDMIFVKRAGDHMFIRFNRAGEQLLGWSREELLGKTDHDFYPREQADFFHLKDREAFERGELIDIPEEPITTRDGSQRWLHTKKVPVYDDQRRPLYLLGIAEDITDRKLAEERARALERELAQVVLMANDAIVTWAPDTGTIASWNPAAEGLYGLSAAEAIGTPLEQLIPPPLRAELQDNVARLVGGQKVAIAETFKLRRGREIEVEESLFLLPATPDRPARIAAIARDISEVARLRRAAEILTAEAAGASLDAVSSSPAMREVIDNADVVAQDAHASVLLLGETGVGKSWLARRIHQRSPREHRPFFAINCASLAPQLLESELFGHERGAFTGATGQKRGLVEAADGGTVFLDEVGELPANAQAQILTFLDERRFRRLGGTRVLEADVRILAATNVDLLQLAASGRFRKDLYYRLSVVPILMPALRERREDIPTLARQVLHDLGARSGRRDIATLGRGVSAALQRYDWPGNVRELRNALERAVILSRGEAVELRHLPGEIRAQGDAGARASSEKLEDVERQHILRVLESVDANRTRAAEILGVSRSTLKRKLAELIRAGVAVPLARDED